jgi:hypothetical protein
MYRMAWSKTGEIVVGGTIRLGGFVDPADMFMLDRWISQDRVTALRVEELQGIRKGAVEPFVLLVRARGLTVYGAEGSEVFGELERAGLMRGRELVSFLVTAKTPA